MTAVAVRSESLPAKALSGEIERSAAWVESLRRELEPASLEDIRDAVKLLDKAGGGKRLSGPDREDQLAVYVLALQGVSKQGLQRAARAWIQGRGEEGSNYAFAPMPPQLRRLVDQEEAHLRQRLASEESRQHNLIEQRDGFPEATEEARERIGRRLEQLRRDLAVAETAGQDARESEPEPVAPSEALLNSRLVRKDYPSRAGRGASGRRRAAAEMEEGDA